jgi:hypothetical protein
VLLMTQNRARSDHEGGHGFDVHEGYYMVYAWYWSSVFVVHLKQWNWNRQLHSSQATAQEGSMA